MLDGQIYIAGGFGAGARADRYDPATDRWQRLADLPVETNHPGIAALGGRVIVAGGYAMDGASAYRGMWAYDPDDDAWEAIGELPEPMGAFGLTTLPTTSTWSAARSGRSTANRRQRSGVRAGDGSWEERAPLAHAREHLAVVAGRADLRRRRACPRAGQRSTRQRGRAVRSDLR